MNTQKTGVMTIEESMQSAAIPGMIKRLGTNPTINQETYQEIMKTELIFSKVNVRPNLFSTSVTLEVTSNQNHQVVVRMSNDEGQIIKLFGWYLLKGTNVTTISDLQSFNSGIYSMAILGNDGELMYSTEITKG